MSDDQACIVPEIKMEHLGLSAMALLPYPAFERRPARITPDAESAMLRNATLPSYWPAADLKLTA